MDKLVGVTNPNSDEHRIAALCRRLERINSLKRPTHQQGSALVIALASLLFAASLAAAMYALYESRADVSTQRLDRTQAFFAAETARMFHQQGANTNGSIPFAGGGFSIIDDGEDKCDVAKIALGWAGGSTVDEARAAVRLCAGSAMGAGTGDGLLDPNTYSDWDCHSNDITHESNNWGKSFDDTCDNLYLDKRVNGSGDATVLGDSCLSEDSRINGAINFQGDVYLQDGAQFSGAAPNFSGCLYVDGKVVDEHDESGYTGNDCDKAEGTELEGSHDWCGAEANGGGNGLHWGYAR